MTRRAGTLEITAATNPGLVRPVNEDAIVVGQWLGLGEDASLSVSHHLSIGILLAVADGLGGYEGGNVASKMVVEGLAAHVSDLNSVSSERLTSAVSSIDQDIRNKAMSEPHLRLMGSTVAMAFASSKEITVLNIGDSRIYFSDSLNELRQVSIDDVATDQSSNYTHSTDSNLFIPRSSRRITQAVGITGLRRSPLRPHLQTIETSTPWTLLLCSDGLTDYVSEPALTQLVTSPSCTASDLIEMALAGGGGDNISVVLARSI